jgi:hypothetical protein
MLTHPRRLAGFFGVAVLMLLGCGAPDTSGPTPCAADRFAAAAPVDTGWRALVLAQMALVPADTTLMMLFEFVDSVRPTDRALVQEAGGTITSEWTVIPGFAARLPAAGAKTLAGPAAMARTVRIYHASADRVVCADNET